MESSYMFVGNVVKGMLNKYSNVDIKDGIDVLLECCIDYLKEGKFVVNCGMFDSKMLDRGSSVLIDIKNNNYSSIEVGEKIVNLFM